jgi:hypothetical protein
MDEKTFHIEDYIATYDNYITKEECNKAIKLFEDQNKFNKTFNRIRSEGTEILTKSDNQFFGLSSNLDIWWEELKTIILNFDIAWNHYGKHTGAIQSYGNIPFHYTNLKIQKTLPKEGYHIWHVEHGASYIDSSRAFVFSIYLNDVEEGGETEFLNFSKRVKPKAGRIVIWPAAFPYVHRGNPPLAGEKYILTSWMVMK